MFTVIEPCNLNTVTAKQGLWLLKSDPRWEALKVLPLFSNFLIKLTDNALRRFINFKCFLQQAIKTDHHSRKFYAKSPRLAMVDSNYEQKRQYRSYGFAVHTSFGSIKTKVKVKLGHHHWHSSLRTIEEYSLIPFVQNEFGTSSSLL